MNAANLILDV